MPATTTVDSVTAANSDVDVGIRDDEIIVPRFYSFSNPVVIAIVYIYL